MFRKLKKLIALYETLNGRNPEWGHTVLGVMVLAIDASFGKKEALAEIEHETAKNERRFFYLLIEAIRLIPDNIRQRLGEVWRIY